MKGIRFVWLLPFVGLAVWSLLPRSAPERATGREWERQAVVGTWVERGGAPGNFVRLELEKILSSSMVDVLEGVITFSHQFKFAGVTKAIWNVEHSQPLRLNILFHHGSGFLAVRLDDPDHARMRYLTKIEDAMKPDVLDHPDTKRLERSHSPQR